ncbi:hypothetical protein SEPCBS119000_005679 [Sporothrix epigloea]|uniref:Endoplasmic reticulum junction formation protein lunapark n=1 Tax=Sporothrix epigloea TaxID=1892477 RepID=A0ABP0DYV4_9PEZI
MVSLWPWRRDDDSPASFEKALSALASRIAVTQAKLDRTRSTSRRVRVLCVLYLTFGYLVYAIVLVLVVGWKNMGALEWSGLAGGPLLIYATRKAFAAFYNFRIDTLAAKLKEQQDERAKTIQKLKDATRYDSTLQLLEKYGGAEAKADSSKAGETAQLNGKRGKGGPTEEGGNGSVTNRTRLPPPPTANIQHEGSQDPGLAANKGSVRAADRGARTARGSSAGTTDLAVSAEFAPNAFGADTLPAKVPGGQYATPSDVYAGASHWYDRILDLLMGDDETMAKNRIVLICSSCRLVNGQAPPGTKSLAEVGYWKCMGCGVRNGEMSEAKKIVNEVLQQKNAREVADSEAESDDMAGGAQPEVVEDLSTGRNAVSDDKRGLRSRGKKAI